jgi:hypothetical protein
MKIDFEFDTKHGKYRDALHLPDNHTFTEAEIQAMKEQRRDKWINFLENPPSSLPETNPNPVPAINHPKTVQIEEETYALLDGVPPTGAKLIEVNGAWYYKV